MSKKSIFKAKSAVSVGLALMSQLLLIACAEQEITHSTDAQLVTSDIKTAKKPEVIEIEGQTYIRDEVDGTLYEANPNRKPVPMGDVKPEILGKESAAQYAAFDHSGQVEVRVWECKSISRKEHQNVTCEVESDFVVVGGGARTVYYGNGALLTEARPMDRGLYTYAGSSKSHLSSDQHDLYVYVIGMRLAGLSRYDLWKNTDFNSKTGTSAEWPEASVSPSSGYVLIGGGTKVNWSGNGNMLTQSYPRYTNGWYGAGKSHKVSSPATVTVYAIGIKPNISGWGSLSWEPGTGGYPIGSNTSTGSIVHPAPVDHGYVLTCPGVRTWWDNASHGRLLYGIYPNPEFRGGYWGASKDHMNSSMGNLDLYDIQIQKSL